MFTLTIHINAMLTSASSLPRPLTAPARTALVGALLAVFQPYGAAQAQLVPRDYP